MDNSRTPLSITLSVWKALFLREALSRLSTGRAAWLWLLLDPMAQIAAMAYVGTVERVGNVRGENTSLWIMIGVADYVLFQRTLMQSMNAINANQALFSYRQVKPVDTVLVRAVLEGMLMIPVIIILCACLIALGIDAIPGDPLLAMGAIFGVWLLGLGLGLIFSVLSELVPEVGKFVSLTTLPIHFASGVLLSLALVPEPYFDWLMFNPLAHGLEGTRLGFLPEYHAFSQLSISYLYSFALVSVFLGLALHNRFAARLVTQ
jgi:capsular polysaccharide transport system permease protein